MWQKLFPHIFDLYEHSDKNHPDNYFSTFSVSLQNPFAKEFFQKLENNLSILGQDAWKQLLKTTLPYVTIKDVKKKRGYYQLFNKLNEAQGYIFLRNQGYSDIHFIEEKISAPDIFAIQKNSSTLLEVKTINVSDSEIKYLETKFPGKKPRDVEHGLTKAFKDKLYSTINSARKQLLYYQPKIEHRRIGFLIIEFDTNAKLAPPNYDHLKTLVQEHSDNRVELVHSTKF